jgi:hypothetical protein
VEKLFEKWTLGRTRWRWKNKSKMVLERWVVRMGDRQNCLRIMLGFGIGGETSDSATREFLLLSLHMSMK